MMVKNKYLPLLCAVLALMMLFTGVGYAALTRSFAVNASVSLDAPVGLYISSVQLPDGANAVVNSYIGTVLNSTVTLGNNKNSTLAVQVTIRNNSNTVYAFDSVLYSLGAGSYDNENITFSLSGLKKNQQLAGQATVTFTITFAYTGNNTSNRTLNSVLNFNFIEYIPGVADHFETILNDETSFNKLVDRMDTTGSLWQGERTDDSYVGNVVGATTDDSKLLNELFTVGEENMLKLPNISSTITAMIKRENLDNNTATGQDGMEMTLYMTAETIGRADVVVYAIVFTKHSADGDWVQLGEMYQGMAETNNYIYDGYGTPNSFNTDTWRASLNYYGVTAGSNATLSAIIAAYKAQGV